MLGRLFGRAFRTQPSLTESDYQRAGRALLVDGVCSSSMATLQGGPFLAAFAIALGASNYDVGLLATIGFLSQFAQLGGLVLLEKLPYRRGVVVLAAGASRMTWVLIILTPILFAGRGVTFLMQWLFLAALIGALAGPAWNSLIRDVVPQDQMGRVFSRRMAFSTAFALVLTMAGGFFVDFWKNRFPDAGLYAYSILFAAGLAFGLLGIGAVSRLPDPGLPADRPRGVLNALSRPAKDRNYRGLLMYIASWNFAINLAGPFFIVYLLKRIGLSFGMVTALTVTSQVVNLVFLRIWGKLADRYSNKSVLRVSGPLFLVAILLWTFTTLPERYFLTIPLLFFIHILTGMSVAGVSLSSANIALKLSPEGQAQSYMTLYGLAGAATGAVAPMLGGVFADFFRERALSIQLGWAEPTSVHNVYAVSLRSLDFLFLLAFLAGLFSLRFLRKVAEQGDVDEKVVREELLSETFSTFRVISTVPGLRHLVAGPISMGHKLAEVVRKNGLKEEPQATPESPGQQAEGEGDS